MLHTTRAWIGIVAALALLGLLFTRRLPTELLGKESGPPMEGADPPPA